MEPATISALVISRNSSNYVKSCLKLLYGQTRIPDEVVLVDRGSHDLTVDLARQDFPSVHVIQSRRDPGAARAINEGIRRTAGDFLLVLYAEVQLDREYVAKLFDAIVSNGPRVGSACGKVYKMFRGHGVLDSAGISFDTAAGFPAKRGEGQQGRDNYETQEPVFGAAQYAAMYRRRMIHDLAVGGKLLDEDPHFDEFDLSWRAQLRGWKSMYVPSATAKADIRERSILPHMKAVHREAGKLLQKYKNLMATDVQDHICGMVIAEVGRQIRNFFQSPHLLLSLPVTAMLMPEVRIRKQIVRKSRRVGDSRLEPPGFES